MAGLIPQAFIDDLLHRVDIVDVIDKRITLKKTGKNYSACCPFHNEKTPSFSVEPKRQFYYCFGCGNGGNAIGFVMEYDQLSFPEAVESLAGEAGIDVPREESKAAARKQSEHVQLIDMLERTSKFYQHQIRYHDNRHTAVDYLKSRGVSGEVTRDFGLGYAPPGWNNLLTALGKDNKEQGSLFNAGLVIQKDRDQSQDNVGTKHRPEANTGSQSVAASTQYYDRFRHRIMFPIRDSRGRTIAFGGRVLGDDKPKYLNSPETPVFHKSSELYGLYQARKSGAKLERLLIVEGYMDVIALAQMGIRNAVASMGTATSATHLRRVFQFVPEIVFCFDGDQAGRTAAWRALEASLPLLKDGRRVKFLFLPEGEDPDTLVRKIGEPEFSSKIEQATLLENFFFEKLSAGLNLDSIEGRARLSNLAKPLIKNFPRGVYAQLMLDRLSATLGVDSVSLKQLMESSPPPSEPAAPPLGQEVPQHISDPVPGYGRQGLRSGKANSNLAVYRKSASLKAIELLLRNPEIALSVKQGLEALDSAEDESRKLLLSLIKLVQKEPHIETITLLGYCYGTSLGGQLTQLLKSEKITPTEGIEEEFHQILDSILSDITQKLELLQLQDKLKSHVDATNRSDS